MLSLHCPLFTADCVLRAWCKHAEPNCKTLQTSHTALIAELAITASILSGLP